MTNRQNRRYRVGATYQGKPVVFNVVATTGPKAVAEARHQARTKGMKFIVVNYVNPVQQTIIMHGMDYGAPLTAMGGPCNISETESMYAGESSNVNTRTISVGEINDFIRRLWEWLVVFVPKPDAPPLKAYEQGGRVFLDDGVNSRQELLSRSPIDLVIMLYEWVTYTGYFSGDFEDFVQNYWP